MKKIVVALMLVSLACFARPQKVVTIGSNQNFTTGWVNFGNAIDMSNSDSLAIAVKYTANDTTGMFIRAVGKMEDSSTADVFQLPILSSSTSTLAVYSENYTLPDTAQNTILQMNVGASGLVPFVQLQIKATTTGATPAVMHGIKAITACQHDC